MGIFYFEVKIVSKGTISNWQIFDTQDGTVISALVLLDPMFPCSDCLDGNQIPGVITAMMETASTAQGQENALDQHLLQMTLLDVKYAICLTKY